MMALRSRGGAALQPGQLPLCSQELLRSDAGPVLMRALVLAQVHVRGVTALTQVHAGRKASQ